jgi:hypothetical protein
MNRKQFTLGLTSAILAVPAMAGRPGAAENSDNNMPTTPSGTH